MFSLVSSLYAHWQDNHSIKSENNYYATYWSIIGSRISSLTGLELKLKVLYFYQLLFTMLTSLKLSLKMLAIKI